MNIEKHENSEQKVTLAHPTQVLNIYRSDLYSAKVSEENQGAL